MNANEIYCIEQAFDATMVERDCAFDTSHHLRERYDKLKKQLRYLRDKNQELQQENETFKQEQFAFVRQNAIAKNAVEALRAEIEILKSQLVAYNNDELEMRLENEALKSTVKDCEEYIRTSREKYDRLRVDFERVCEELIRHERMRDRKSVHAESKTCSHRTVSGRSKSRRRVDRSRHRGSETSRQPKSRIRLELVDTSEQSTPYQTKECKSSKILRIKSLSAPMDNLTLTTMSTSDTDKADQRPSNLKKPRQSMKITKNLRCQSGQNLVQNQSGQQDISDGGQYDATIVVAPCLTNRREDANANLFTYLGGSTSKKEKSKGQSAMLSVQRVRLRHSFCTLQ